MMIRPSQMSEKFEAVERAINSRKRYGIARISVSVGDMELDPSGLQLSVSETNPEALIKAAWVAFETARIECEKMSLEDDDFYEIPSVCVRFSDGETVDTREIK